MSGAGTLRRARSAPASRRSSSPALRLGVVGVVVLSLFGAMVARLWYLQVLSGPAYRIEAQNNRVRLVYTEAPRGRILDRQGRVLVGNEVVSAVLVDRQAIAERPDVKARLAILLGVTTEQLEVRLADQRFSPFKPVPVADEVPKDLLLYLLEHQGEFPGVQGVQRTRRSYPHGSLAAHALGYVGQINDRELEPRRPRGYRAGDTIGKSGVELAYEDDLRGEPEIEKLEVDSDGRVLRTLNVKPAVAGNDVVLNLDLDVQRVAEESLSEGLKAAQGTYDNDQLKRFLATAGSAVVVDPRDGAVVAMASSPTYDPRELVDGIGAARFTQLQAPEGRYPLNNRVIQGLYPPGSTFKLASAFAGLSDGLVAARDTIEDTGSVTVGGTTKRNALGKAHGRVDLPRAIAVSSDVYFYRLGQRFWEARGRYGETAIQDAACELGLGASTGLELPFEAGGRVSDPARRAADNRRNPKAYPEGKWYTGDNMNLAIGQGETVSTPLQLANAYAAFANGGDLYATRLGKAVRSPGGKEIRTIPSRIVRRIDLPASVRSPMLAGFVGAVSDPKGTAFGAFSGFPLQQWPVAGKTGTAQAPPRQDTALFVGFAPASSPQAVVAVVMEEAGFGSVAAAPVARRILESVLGLAPNPVIPGQGSD